MHNLGRNKKNENSDYLTNPPTHVEHVELLFYFYGQRTKQPKILFMNTL